MAVETGALNSWLSSHSVCSAPSAQGGRVSPPLATVQLIALSAIAIVGGAWANEAWAVTLPTVGPNESLLRDNVTNTSWRHVGAVDHDFANGADASSAGFAEFTGTGNPLNRIGVVVSKVSSTTGAPNGGDWTKYDGFDIIYHDSLATVQSDPFLLNPSGNNVKATKATPDNIDYLTPVLVDDFGAEAFYFEFDISSFGINPIAGVSHYISVVPVGSGLVTGARGGLYLSDSGQGGLGDYYNSPLLGLSGRFDSFGPGIPPDAAFFLTDLSQTPPGNGADVPEPASAILLISALGALTNGRRRRDRKHG